MDERVAAELIADAVRDAGSIWAEIGAGTGTFTRALRSLLPRESRIYAIDNDAQAVVELGQIGTGVIPVEADFSRDIAWPGESPPSLDGLLLANALHFVREAEIVLRRLVRPVRPGGRVVIVEYDRRAANPWVPHPIRSSRWPGLAHAAGLTNARITARTPSQYAGELYVGVADKPT
jgi:ubiquinone/menaquinone biosynthesis C-methylase UbiE